ncbi:M1 family aminopeptidase, partial [Bacteroidota bacterium]
TLYHREDDNKKLENNVNKIFDLHFSSLKWLEEYTQIEYPFQKFEFIIIPSFQYSGMEHPGATLYRDSKLFLGNTSTIQQELDRANLIAHETAHMWFGNLVTMEWFNEVWLKEVFANFIADKIIYPQYPEINHEINFLINHFPKSYSVDRTKGANPINQELKNMKNAGTLYGNIIYHKAPIVMKHLENIIGEKLLQEGLQEYLSKYQYGNASWNNLISILNFKVDYNLEEWSSSWVCEPGMPNYNLLKAYDDKNQFTSLIIEQIDPLQNGRQWSQEIDVIMKDNKSDNIYNIELKDTFNVIELERNDAKPLYIFLNANGLGYGYFKIDSISIKYILEYLYRETDPVLKCSMYISLWENMLNQNIKPTELLTAYINSLKTEGNPQIVSLLLSYLETIYWKFITINEREKFAPIIEDLMWESIQNSTSNNLKYSFFCTYKKILLTHNGVENLYKIWNNDIIISGLDLSEKDFTEIAFELAIRNKQGVDLILDKQYNRIKSKERQERFAFIRPSVSDSKEVRNEFFENLKKENNREKEPWVIDAINYLHHPLRSEESLKYLIPSLQILEELQTTGDIFFPKQWLDATFSGHSSIDAIMDINLFLNENPFFPEKLRNKILQSADLVYRASIIKNE